MPTKGFADEMKFLSSSTMLFVLAAVLASAGCSQKESASRAVEGRGLLPRPSELKNPETLSVPASHAFRPLSSKLFASSTSRDELFSRDLFETSEGGNFTFRVQELSVPPGQGPVGTTFQVSTLLEMRSPRGLLRIGGSNEAWKQDAIIGVPAGAAIELTNPTDRELIVRLYFTEAK